MSTSASLKSNETLEASAPLLRRRWVAEHESRRRGQELRTLFVRLGLAPTCLETVAAARSGSDVPEPLRDELTLRLETERRRLVRLARARSPAYDLDRHIAVSTAARWLSGAEPPSQGLTERASGSVLNARFKRRGPPLYEAGRR